MNAYERPAILLSNVEKPLRPRDFAEKRLITAILDGTYPPGTPLPGERALAQALGITRPTLRETLQRLSREGWIKIRHGKPSVINDYWRHGGLSLLGTLAAHGEFLPDGFISHLLEVRIALLPEVAALSATRSADDLETYLADAPALADRPEPYAAYDWGLQLKMARASANPIFSLILNDFTAIYQSLGERYFASPQARRASMDYYLDLRARIGQGPGAVAESVRRAMTESLRIWQTINPKSKGDP